MTNNNIAESLCGNFSGNFYGYIEGYYGQLLSWSARHELLAVMAELGMNSYFYAPKDDAAHRFDWRQSYDADWRRGFANFTAAAARNGIQIIAGIAPGLDFNFASLDQPRAGDFACLVDKARQLSADGASHVSLLMDDIAADFTGRAGSFQSEGTAHAALANQLADAIDRPLIMVPRIYADSLISEDDPQSLPYLADLTAALAPQMPIVYCGNDIVAQQMGADISGYIAKNRLIIWDNFYANDYCPRRLFVGPWRRPSGGPNVMLNPTGLVETDKLLLQLMPIGDDAESWRDFLARYVPEEFFPVACYFDAPYGFAAKFATPPTQLAIDAVDHLLWRWKSPLQREWYPALMGLKQDLLMADGHMADARIGKTQSAPLAALLAKPAR